MVKENCNNALLSIIIKEWGCFARQKTRTKIEEFRNSGIKELKRLTHTKTQRAQRKTEI